jgi:hypothetical protein
VTFQVRRLVAPPSNLEEALTLMSPCDCLSLRHSWPGAHGLPANVWLGHTAGQLFILAYIPDEAIWSTASGHNQRLWELGDTFEMFFQTEGRQEYYEFHVAPSNFRLQLRFPSPEEFAAKREDAFEEFLLPEDSFTSETAIRERDWVVFSAIPTKLVGKSKTWRFSFCRYDYASEDEEPNLSSTSDYRELDFHRIEDWGTLKFEQ